MTLAWEKLVEQAQHGFAKRYGHEPEWTVLSPGRANFIGDHTDYNDGFCLPFAIDRYTVLCGARSAQPGQHVRLASRAQQKATTATTQINIESPIAGAGDWTDYVRGVLQGYQNERVSLPPLDIYIDNNLPLGAGLSSSASLELGTSILVEAASDIHLDPAARIRLCQRAEHEYAGVPCGLLDQFAVSMGRADHLMIFDSLNLDANHIAMASEDVRVLVINSRVEHALGDSEYATRRRECEMATKQLGLPLRDATLDQVDNRLAHDPVLQRRARHVVSENARVHATAAALTAGSWKHAGQLMFASHASLRDDYEVSCDETDALVNIALELGPPNTDSIGAWGARMTGGGFGGSVLVLTDSAIAQEVGRLISEAYHRQTGIQTEAIAVNPVRGTHLLGNRP